MPDVVDKVKARIRQLRQMTRANGATEGEVLNALAIAERLMREHGLDEQEVDALAPVTIAVELGRSRWQRVDSLIGAVARFAEVQCWVQFPGGRARVDHKLATLGVILATQGVNFKTRKIAAKKIERRYDEALYAGDRAGHSLPLNPGVGERPDRIAGLLPAAVTDA